MKTTVKLLTLILALLALSCQKDEQTVSPTPKPTPTPTPVTKSSAKEITKFSFAALSPAVDATIDATAKSISSTLAATNDLTKLTPTITLSDKATVSPTSGTVQDFSKEVSYTVTAEDGSTQVYKVNLKKEVLAININCNSIPDIWEDISEGVDYTVNCNVNISKAVIIKPGVKVQFESGGGITVGGSNGSLNMIGTKEKPIILEGKIATPGSWRGVGISSVNISNQWEYVTLKHADGANALGWPDKGGLSLSSLGKVGIKNCTFLENLDYGLSVTSADETTSFYSFENNTFTSNKKSGLMVNFADMGMIDGGSNFTSNGQNYIEVRSKYTTENLTIQKTKIPFRISDIIQIGTKIILNSGVQIEFGSNAGLYLAESVKSASFTANGTAEEPIKFLGYLPETKGVWAGLNLGNNNIENKLNYCIIDGAGSKTPQLTNFDFWFDKKATSAVIIDGIGYKSSYKATVTNCVISNSSGYGLAYSKYSKDAVTESGNTFKNNAKDNVIIFSY